MQSSKQGKVTGMKAFKGNIDGQEIDGCTIFVEAKLKGENSKGYASQSYKWGKSENAKKIAPNGIAIARMILSLRFSRAKEFFSSSTIFSTLQFAVVCLHYRKNSP